MRSGVGRESERNRITCWEIYVPDNVVCWYDSDMPYFANVISERLDKMTCKQWHVPITLGRSLMSASTILSVKILSVEEDILERVKKKMMLEYASSEYSHLHISNSLLPFPQAHLPVSPKNRRFYPVSLSFSTLCFIFLAWLHLSRMPWPSHRVYPTLVPIRLSNLSLHRR
jgi:hypothetical protein